MEYSIVASQLKNILERFYVTIMMVQLNIVAANEIVKKFGIDKTCINARYQGNIYMIQLEFQEHADNRWEVDVDCRKDFIVWKISRWMS